MLLISIVEKDIKYPGPKIYLKKTPKCPNLSWLCKNALTYCHQSSLLRKKMYVQGFSASLTANLKNLLSKKNIMCESLPGKMFFIILRLPLIQQNH